MDGIEYLVLERLSEGELEDIFTTAIEGGIGYWACLWNDTKTWDEAEKELEAAGKEIFYGNVIWQILKTGGKVKFSDAEDDKTVWYLTLNKFKNGCIKYAQERGSIAKSLAEGSFDADEADILMQYALFGEVVYG